MKTIQSLVSEIRALAKSGARFASLVYTAKASGEIARHTVCLGVSLEMAYKRDIALLAGLIPKLRGNALEAALQLNASLTESLLVGIGHNSAYTCKGVYETLAPGLKLHLEKGELLVYGFTIGKTIIQAGTHKAVRSSALTLAKASLRRRMKSGRFRQFALSALESVTLNGKTLVLE